MSRKLFFVVKILVLVFIFSDDINAQVAGDYGAFTSGIWNTPGIWKVYNGSSWAGSPVAAASPASASTNVFILPGSTVSLSTSQTPCNNLTINPGGKLWTSSSGSNTYLYVYGNITCDGTIGNAAIITTITGSAGAFTITVGSAAGLVNGMNITGTGIGLGAVISNIIGTTITLSTANTSAVSGNGSFILFDAISFGIEGPNCLFTGTGIVDCSRIRKNLSTILTTNLIIDININLRFSTGSTTQIYNTADGTIFNVTLNAGKTLNLTTTSGYTGNVAMDGIYGNDPSNRGGSYLIKGTMVVTGSLYLNTNNGVGGYPCSFTIDPTGIVITPNVIANNSGSSTHTLNMNPGSLLQITGAPTGQFFFLNNNIYNLSSGSTIEYTGTGSHIIDNSITYANLKLSTGAVNKTALGVLNVNGDLTIASPAVFVPNAATPIINLAGNWINYNSTGFTEGVSSVNMIGTANQTITCPLGEDYYLLKVNKPSGKLYLSSATPTIARITNTLDLTLGNIVTSSIGAGNYYIQIQNTAAVINTSDNSFIENSCARQLAAGSPVNFTFPVGKSGKYRSEAINGIPNANCLVFGEFYLADPNTVGAVTSKALSLDHISRCEYWRIKQQGSAAAQNFIVTLSWATFSNCFIVNTLADLRVTSWNIPTASIWNDLGNLTASGSMSSGTIPAAVPIGFVSSALGTAFTLASSTITNPLPIELISFDAKPNGKNVEINWITETEIQNDYFNVQKSKEGFSFADINKIEGAGTSSVTHDYSAIDENPFEGISYYRLKQTDFDGTTTYSRTIAIKFGEFDDRLKLFPNPAHDHIQILLPAGLLGNADLKIIDPQGRIMKIFKINTGELTYINISIDELSNGIYYAVFENELVNCQKVFIKN